MAFGQKSLGWVVLQVCLWGHIYNLGGGLLPETALRRD